MNVYRVQNYFDRSMYFVAVDNEEEMMKIVDAKFLERLNEIDDDNGQYDDLRNDYEKRKEEIWYEMIIEKIEKGKIVECQLSDAEMKYYNVLMEK